MHTSVQWPLKMFLANWAKELPPREQKCCCCSCCSLSPSALPCDGNWNQSLPLPKENEDKSLQVTTKVGEKIIKSCCEATKENLCPERRGFEGGGGGRCGQWGFVVCCVLCCVYLCISLRSPNTALPLITSFSHNTLDLMRTTTQTHTLNICQKVIFLKKM